MTVSYAMLRRTPGARGAARLRGVLPGSALPRGPMRGRGTECWLAPVVCLSWLAAL